MRVVVDRRAQVLELRNNARLKLEAIDTEEQELKGVAKKQEVIDDARKYYAAARIQGLVRGFLNRLVTVIKRKEYRAALMIQKVLRGRQGKKRWLAAFWRNEAVVLTTSALELVIERSTVIREQDKKVGYWKEMFDPVTNRFWYYQYKSGQNTYKCPLVFQKELVCRWQGYGSFGGDEKRCTCVFSDMNDYQAHMLTKHKWFCPACDHKNSGLSFPVCTLCDNTVSGDGDSGFQTLETSLQAMNERLDAFLDTQVGTNRPNFSLKDKLMDLASTTKSMMATNESSADEFEHLFSQSDGIGVATSKKGKTSVLQTSNSTGRLPTSKTLPAGPGKLTKVTAVFNKPNSKSVFNKSNATLESSAPGPPRDPIEQRLEDVPEMTFAAVVSQLMADRVKTAPVVRTDEELEDMELYKTGHIDPPVFDAMFERTDRVASDSDEKYDDSDVSLSGADAETCTTVSWDTVLDGERMEVCSKFLKDECTLNSCPLAHPGLRDKAKIFYSRVVGAVRKVPFVALCIPALSGECVRTRLKDCRHYHTYIRPSTENIVNRLFPIQGDKKTKFFSGGAVLKGKVNREHIYNGFGVLSWPDSSTYMGMWRENKRNGFGLYRSVNGIEYCGMWKDGLKDGFGVLRHPNGEEYSGEWVEGVMSGLGALISRSGDKYRGQFENHKYEGLGFFTRTTGEVYMGYFKDGMAHGIGVQGCLGGEKYKGFFDRNHRHGKGVCLFANGSKYAGEWYRNIPNGFGVYVQPNRERYVGSWSAGKMHGAGRYYFANKDFYDGEFKMDVAEGYGVYYHAASGGLFKGQWKRNMRNGRGTYVYGNGSKYTGNWEDNIIAGKGKMDFACGSHYRGEFKDMRKHGKGIFTWPNLNIYKGQFDMCVMRGFGEMKYMTGHRYIGQWDNNKKNGRGIMYYKNGDIYEGDWVDDLRVGKGKLIYHAGSSLQESYDGDWDNDEKHGYGAYVYGKTEGSIYEGQWKRGVRHGQGKLTFKDKSFYRGTFNDEQMDGYGVHVSAKNEDGNSSQYEGQWKGNMRHGTGSLIDTDGSIYHGKFFENRKHGQGSMQYANGTTYTGIWEYNQIRGSGSVTLPFGDTPYGGPTEVTVKVFGY